MISIIPRNDGWQVFVNGWRVGTYKTEAGAERRAEKERVPAIIALIVADCERMIRDWEQGRNASPDQLDYVIAADRILTQEDPTYIGSTPEGREFVADVLYEDSGETYVTFEDIAKFLYEQLTAE